MTARGDERPDDLQPVYPAPRNRVNPFVTRDEPFSRRPGMRESKQGPYI